MNIEVGVICTLLGAALGYLSYRKASNKDVREDAKSNAYLSTKLDYIGTGVDDIRLDIKAQASKIDAINERLIRNEESTKSAHHRIDELEKK